jgi:hypothetical protein
MTHIKGTKQETFSCETGSDRFSSPNGSSARVQIEECSGANDAADRHTKYVHDNLS